MKTVKRSRVSGPTCRQKATEKLMRCFFKECYGKGTREKVEIDLVNILLLAIMAIIFFVK